MKAVRKIAFFFSFPKKFPDFPLFTFVHLYFARQIVCGAPSALAYRKDSFFQYVKERFIVSGGSMAYQIL